MTTVLASPYAPVTGTGRAQRMLAIVQGLARLGPVRFVYVPFEGEEPDRAFAGVPDVDFVRVSPTRRARRVGSYVRARARGVPAGVARGAHPALAAGALRAAGSGNRLVADGPVAMAALLSAARRRPVVYNAYNLESSFRGGASMARFERLALRTAAQSWMVSWPDLEGARALAPQADLRYVPNVIDVRAIRPTAPAAPTGRVLFAADHRYAPNREGKLFLDEAMEHLRRQRPGAKLVLTGRGLREDPDARDHVEVAGFVDDLAPLYGSCDAVAVPLLQGGGSPLKFIEAMAHGRPVVATPHAARGLVARPGEHFLAGETPQRFAQQLHRCLRGEADEVSRRGRALAEAEYSIEALVERLVACP